MKKILIGILFTTSLTVLGESGFYRCKNEKSLLKIEVEVFHTIKLKNVHWEDLFATNETSTSSKVMYGQSWNEVDFVSSSAEIESFHLRLTKEDYSRLKNLPPTFKALAYTKNSRGFIWVDGTKVFCQKFK